MQQIFRDAKPKSVRKSIIQIYCIAEYTSYKSEVMSFTVYIYVKYL
jgi:hypothetical protein